MAKTETEVKETKEKQPGNGKKKKILLIVLAVLILFVGFRIFSAKSGGGDSDMDEKTAVNVQVVTAQRENVEVQTPLSGKIEPKDQVSVPAMMQSEVKAVYVEVGDYVNAGSTLFTQDTAQIQGSYDSAAANVNMAKEALASAKLNYDRMSLLYQEGATSQQNYDSAKTQYATAQQQLSAAQAGLSTAAESLKNGTATAPISGYVTEVNVTQGAYPNAALAAVSIANTSDLEIKTSVSEYLIGKISVGQKVNVVVNSLSSEPFTATITNIAPAPSSGTLTYPITVKIDDSQASVVAGMFAEVQIVSDKRENVIAVPSDAVLIKGGETQVVVLDKENKPSYVPVETGLDNGAIVEIVSGLKEGQTVVCVGQNYIIEGEPVNILSNAGDSDKTTDQ